MAPKATGSSPLTRGKPVVAEPFDLEGGLIPAHAGKTCEPAAPDDVLKAHPRSRGENQGTTLLQRTADGSSPLTRGKLVVPKGRADELGLIPAHAGKTARRPRRVCRGTAHPRSRGENREWIRRTSEGRGSSPLTRGKHGGD